MTGYAKRPPARVYYIEVTQETFPGKVEASYFGPYLTKRGADKAAEEKIPRPEFLAYRRKRGLFIGRMEILVLESTPIFLKAKTKVY